MFIFKSIIAIAFIIVGGAKLFRAKPLKDQFEEFGLPGYPILVVGALEVLGAIGIMVPEFTLYATIGLQLLLIGAISNHFKTKHPLPSYAPAIVLSISLLSLIYLTIY